MPILLGGAGVYVLCEDGKSVRLLTRLYEQEVSEYSKKVQEELGVYQTGNFKLNVEVRATQPYSFPEPTMYLYRHLASAIPVLCHTCCHMHRPDPQGAAGVGAACQPVPKLSIKPSYKNFAARKGWHLRQSARVQSRGLSRFVIHAGAFQIQPTAEVGSGLRLQALGPRAQR